MARDNGELWELQGDMIQVRDGTPRFRWTQRICMAHLQTERNVEINARRVEGIIPPIIRGYMPHQGTMRTPRKPSSPTHRRTSRMASIGRKRSTDAIPMSRSGYLWTQ